LLSLLFAEQNVYLPPLIHRIHPLETQKSQKLSYIYKDIINFNILHFSAQTASCGLQLCAARNGKTKTVFANRREIPLEDAGGEGGA
jgi:hypothetical protein